MRLNRIVFIDDFYGILLTIVINITACSNQAPTSPASQGSQALTNSNQPAAPRKPVQSVASSNQPAASFGLVMDPTSQNSCPDNWVLSGSSCFYDKKITVIMKNILFYQIENGTGYPKKKPISNQLESSDPSDYFDFKPQNVEEKKYICQGLGENWDLGSVVIDQNTHYACNYRKTFDGGLPADAIAVLCKPTDTTCVIDVRHIIDLEKINRDFERAESEAGRRSEQATLAAVTSSIDTSPEAMKAEAEQKRKEEADRKMMEAKVIFAVEEDAKHCQDFPVPWKKESSQCILEVSLQDLQMKSPKHMKFICLLQKGIMSWQADPSSKIPDGGACNSEPIKYWQMGQDLLNKFRKDGKPREGE